MICEYFSYAALSLLYYSDDHRGNVQYKIHNINVLLLNSEITEIQKFPVLLNRYKTKINKSF